MLSGVVNLSWEYVIHGLERLWVQKMLTLYAFPIFNATMPSQNNKFYITAIDFTLNYIE